MIHLSAPGEWLQHVVSRVAFHCFPAWRLLLRGAKWRLLTGALLEICGHPLAPVKPAVHLKGYRVSQPTWGFTMIPVIYSRFMIGKL